MHRPIAHGPSFKARIRTRDGERCPPVVRHVAEPTELPLIDGKRLQVWAYNGQVPGPTLRIRLVRRCA